MQRRKEEKKFLCNFAPSRLCVEYYFILTSLLFFKAAVVAWVNLQGYVPLDAEEAQYWLWSRHLDIGYYSKPAGIAWEIALGTFLFGHNELGIRFSALLIGTFLPLVVYRLILTVGLSDRIAFWTALLLAFSPLGLLATLLATTDAPYVFFWTLALIPLCKVLKEGTLFRNTYLYVGLWICCGEQFKWTITFFWPLVLMACFIFPVLRSWQLLKGIAVSLFGLIPWGYWNWMKEMPSLDHLTGYYSGHLSGNPLAFLAAQLAFLTPIFFLVFVVSLFRYKEMSQAPRFCAWMAAIPLFIYTFTSFFQKVHGNWCVFIFPPMLVVIAWGLLQCKHLAAYMISGAAFTIVLSFVLWKPSNWNTIATQLTEVGYHPDKEFIAGSNYQLCSLISFYAPSQKRADYLPLKQRRMTQFDLWPGLQQGQSGYFVTDDPFLEPLLRNVFQEIEFKGLLNEKLFLYRCIDYNKDLLIGIP